MKQNPKIKNWGQNKIEDETINNVYDKTFRMILSNKIEACILINEAYNLKNENELKEEDIELCPTNYITKSYENKYCDVVYKVINKEKAQGSVYILIEHQTKVDRKMAYRIYEYTAEIIRKAIKEDKGVIPRVYPIVLYMGEQKWNVETNIDDTKSKLIGAKSVFGTYKLIDSNKYTKKELYEMPGLRAIITSLERLRGNRHMADEIIEMAIEKLDNERKEMLSMYINNVAKNYLDEKSLKIIKNKFKEKGEKANMFGEALRDTIEIYKKEGRAEGKAQGLKEGKKQGLEEGRKEGRKEIAINMKKSGASERYIIEMTGLNKEEVSKLPI